MILITTPTGHIGSKVLEKLIKTNEKLRVLARDPWKLSSEVKSKSEIMQGSLDDSDFVSKAYDGAQSLFLVIPPTMNCTDVNEYYLNFAKVSCDAIRKQKIKRVVYISGTGLGKDKEAGPVYASSLVEELLHASGSATRILHCGSFMENLLHSVQAIKFTNQFSTSVASEIKVPWVATEDIADVAVSILCDKNWSGNESVGVLGPEDLSYNDLAKTMSEVLGRSIQYSAISKETMKSTLMQYGATDAAAHGLIGIYESMNNGNFNGVKRTPDSTSTTSFGKWCEQVLKPTLS